MQNTWVNRFTGLDSSPTTVSAFETGDPYDSQCLRHRLWNRTSRNGRLYLQVFASLSTSDIKVVGWRYDTSQKKLVTTDRSHVLVSNNSNINILTTATSPDGLWAVAAVQYARPMICRFLPADPTNTSAFEIMNGVSIPVDGWVFVFTGDYYLPSTTSVTGSYDSFNTLTTTDAAFPRMIHWQPSQGNCQFYVIQSTSADPTVVSTTYGYNLEESKNLNLYNIGAPGQSDSGVQRSLSNLFMLPNSKKLVYSATKNSNDTVNNCIGVSFETTPGVTSSWQHKLAYEWHEANKKIGRLEYQVVVVNGVSTETCYVGIMNANVSGGIAETGMQLYSFVLPANNQLQQSDFKLVDLEPDDDQTPGTGVSSFGVFKNGDILYRNNFHTKQTYRVAGVPPVPGGFATQADYDAAKLAVGGDSEITKAIYDAVLELWKEVEGKSSETKLPGSGRCAAGYKIRVHDAQ
jgi:hypothetical protein